MYSHVVLEYAYCTAANAAVSMPKETVNSFICIVCDLQLHKCCVVSAGGARLLLLLAHDAKITADAQCHTKQKERVVPCEMQSPGIFGAHYFSVFSANFVVQCACNQSSWCCSALDFRSIQTKRTKTRLSGGSNCHSVLSQSVLFGLNASTNRCAPGAVHVFLAPSVCKSEGCTGAQIPHGKAQFLRKMPNLGVMMHAHVVFGAFMQGVCDFGAHSHAYRGALIGWIEGHVDVSIHISRVSRTDQHAMGRAHETGCRCPCLVAAEPKQRDLSAQRNVQRDLSA